MKTTELARAFKQAKVGDEIIYHRGYHTVDSLGRRTGAAREAWSLYRDGKAVLYQRRIGPDLLQYCLKKVRG